MTDSSVMGARLAGQLAWFSKTVCPYDEGHALRAEWQRGHNEIARMQRR
jgi:hypothetical protein